MGSIMLLLVQLTMAVAIAGTACAATTDNETSVTSTTLTTSGGAPVEYNDTSALNADLLSNEYFVDTMTHFVRQRIPERVVHGKGTGAFGYFNATKDLSSICKAKLFSKVGKTTPIAVRFSPALSPKGSSDTNREPRGFAVKFYTEDGNFDIPGFNTPMISVKDPVLFPNVVNAAQPSPINFLTDLNATWDFLTAQPEVLHLFSLVLSDRGIPDGYRHMPGFGVHTYQVVNDQGVSSFVRFHFSPDAGIKNLLTEEAVAIGGQDPDYATRDLYNAIQNGNFPSWTVSVQILSMKDVKKAKFDVFDVTKVLPLDIYPLTEIGKLVLNRNPVNHFAEMEQLAFCPGNLVPGIVGAPDKAFQARRMAYRDAQYHRLGGNFQNIEVNRPFRKVNDYTRNGVSPVNDNGRDGPNYYPNSFNGPKPYVNEKRVQLMKIYHDPPNNFDQAADIYTKEMSEDEQTRYVGTIVGQLKVISKFLQDRAVKIYKTIHPELGSRIEQGLAN